MDRLGKYEPPVRRNIKSQFRGLLRTCSSEYDAPSMEQIRRSFEFLVVHGGADQSIHGQSLLESSTQLATMAVKELGLDALGVSASIICYTVELNKIPIERVKKGVGERIASIVEELVRIGDLDTSATQGQAENMRNLILTLASDFRVILVKIAERLHHLRHLEALNEEESITAALESRFIYSPLAHRLGLYNVMSEMDDISMSVLDKQAYEAISQKLKASKSRRDKFIREFIQPIKEQLEKERFKVEIRGRPKAISSIWRKMQKQKVDFEEVYDKFAIRVIIDTPLKKEKADCWRAYSIITDHYQPNPERLRDWISAPKSNGYESLHTTVVVPGGEWVEVQIRTRRMNEIAERGLAAHWKYKGIRGQAGIDQWIER